MSKNFSDETINAILEMYVDRTIMVEDIADHFSISSGTLNTIAKAAGVSGRYGHQITPEMLDSNGVKVAKPCRQCEEIKSLDQYSLQSSATDNLCTVCKACQSENSTVAMHVRICRNCGCDEPKPSRSEYCEFCVGPKYDKVDCWVASLRYSGSNHFKQEDRNTWECCRKNDWLKEFFPPRERPAPFTKSQVSQACAAKNTKCKLYLIHCFDDGESFYKIGVTSEKKVSTRFRQGGRSSSQKMPYYYDILWEISGTPSEIYDLEQECHRNTKEYRYQPKLWGSKSLETFQCHGNCGILRKPVV